MAPPKNAVVICVDEKSVDPSVTAYPADAAAAPWAAGARTHDDKRNGTTTLFACLEVATGKVVHTCMPRHRQQQFVKFLQQVAKAYPRHQGAYHL
jgi:hypothetical protein